MKTVLISLLVLFTVKLFAQTGNCVSGNCNTGKGKMVYANSDSYEGDFAGGKMHGKGKLDAEDHVYSGEWKDGYYSGHGLLKNRAQRSSPFYVQYDCTFYGGEITGYGRYANFYGTDTPLVYTGNFKNGQYFGKGNLHIKGICTLYSDSWTDSKNFSYGKFVEEKTGATLYGRYVENNFEKGENNGMSPPGQQIAKNFKRFYFQKANSTILRHNLMVDELVSTLSAPKNGNINISLKDNLITIVTEGAEDQVFTIKSVGDETTDQYSNKKVLITCTDAKGLPCTIAIRREHFYTSDNKMLITTTYGNGTGKGYTCNYEANLFEN